MSTAVGMLCLVVEVFMHGSRTLNMNQVLRCCLRGPLEYDVIRSWDPV